MVYSIYFLIHILYWGIICDLATYNYIINMQLHGMNLLRVLTLQLNTNNRDIQIQY